MHRRTLLALLPATLAAGRATAQGSAPQQGAPAPNPPPNPAAPPSAPAPGTLTDGEPRREPETARPNLSPSGTAQTTRVPPADGGLRDFPNQGPPDQPGAVPPGGRR